jgi:hypothetical protein
MPSQTMRLLEALLFVFTVSGMDGILYLLVILLEKVVVAGAQNI